MFPLESAQAVNQSWGIDPNMTVLIVSALLVWTVFWFIVGNWVPANASKVYTALVVASVVLSLACYIGFIVLHKGGMI